MLAIILVGLGLVAAWLALPLVLNALRALAAWLLALVWVILALALGAFALRFVAGHLIGAYLAICELLAGRSLPAGAYVSLFVAAACLAGLCYLAIKRVLKSRND